MSVPDTQYDEAPIDLDETEERLYELYALWCQDNGLQPTIKEYYQWLDEKYM